MEPGASIMSIGSNNERNKQIEIVQMQAKAEGLAETFPQDFRADLIYSWSPFTIAALISIEIRYKLYSEDEEMHLRARPGNLYY